MLCHFSVRLLVNTNVAILQIGVANLYSIVSSTRNSDIEVIVERIKLTSKRIRFIYRARIRINMNGRVSA